MTLDEYKIRFCAKLVEQADITPELAQDCLDGYTQVDLDEMVEEADPEGAALEELSYWASDGILGGER
jgi:hypothetical protein